MENEAKLNRAARYSICRLDFPTSRRLISLLVPSTEETATLKVMGLPHNKSV